MIFRIESNCQTGEVKYFDENDIEISKEDALLGIASKQKQEE